MLGHNAESVSLACAIACSSLRPGPISSSTVAEGFTGFCRQLWGAAVLFVQYAGARDMQK
jgi:hypothetical protein